MNVTVEELAPCKKLMRVEMESKDVDAAFETMIKNYQKQAALPGFRPGKAPKDMVAKRFEKDIQDEVKRKLISDAYRKAVDDKKLDVVGYPDIEEIQFGRGQALQFAATVETAPTFELPEYKGLTVKRDTTTVTDADVDRAVNMLRERHTDFKTVERPLQTGDVAVVNYTGTCNGKPITDLAPVAKGLTEQKNFWINIEANSFIPGFSEQLVGAKAGDKKTVNVDFPADFVTPQLQNQKGVYEVEVTEVKEKVLPPLDDAFAKQYGAEDLAKLRVGVRADLENELNYKKNSSMRNQLVDQLLEKVSYELPESVVQMETRNVVNNIVQDNHRRGVPKEVIESQKEQIFSVASQNAKLRVKGNFLLQKIAEKEDIKVSQEEVAQRIQSLAAMYQIPADQFVKDLQKRNGVMEIYDQIARDKTLEMLFQAAKVEDAAPEAPKA